MQEDGGATDAATDGPRRGCIGCLTLVSGFFGGGMIALLVKKMIDKVTRCTPPEGLPVCDWHVWFFPGGIVGAVLLTGVAMWRLRRSRSGGGP